MKAWYNRIEDRVFENDLASIFVLVVLVVILFASLVLSVIQIFKVSPPWLWVFIGWTFYLVFTFFWSVFDSSRSGEQGKSLTKTYFVINNVLIFIPRLLMSILVLFAGLFVKSKRTQPSY